MGSLDQIARNRKRQTTSAPARGGSLDRIAHERGGSSGGNEPVDTVPGGKKKSHHRGFLGTVGHVVAQTGIDLKDAALGAPGGIVEVGKTVIAPDYTGLRYGYDSKRHKRALAAEQELGKAYARQLNEERKHPLRHPGNTLLDAAGIFSVGAGTGARVAEAGRLARAGEGAGAATRALRRGPKPGPRVIRVGDLEARGHYSRSAVSRGVQKTVDAGLQKGAEHRVGIAVGKRELSAERILHGRAAKWMGREERVADARARVPGTRLQQLGKKLKPDELRALRLVAEETPVQRRLAGQQLRQARATHPREIARHQERIDLTQAAMEHLDVGVDGKPTLKPGATKLRKVYDALQAASTDRESMLKNLGLMDETGLQTAKTNTARVAAGATYEKPTPAKLGVPSEELVRQTKRVDRLQKVHDRAVAQAQRGIFSPAQRKLIAMSDRLPAGPKIETVVPKTVEDARAQLAALEPHYQKVLDEFGAGEKQAKLTPEEMDIQRGINTDRGKYIQQQTGKTKSGRASGASGYKVQALPKTLNEQKRLKAEADLHDLATRNAHLPQAQQFLKLSDKVAELRQAIAMHEEQTFLGDPSQVDFGSIVKSVAGKRPKPSEVPFPSGKVVTSQGRIIVPRGTARAERIGGALSVAKDELEQMQAAAARRVKPTGIVGQEDLVASPDAVHIGNPTERTKLSGRPRVSSTGSFGHTRRPSSLKTFTGGSVEHALERNDVTNIVAERHVEAVRLSKIDRVRKRLAKAGTDAPSRRDDVFVWTDPLTKNERIPPEVRKYLDNPESVQAMPEADQVSLTEKLRAAVFERHDWEADPESRRLFEQTAAEGKGVFVSRRLVGEYAKKQVSIPGGAFVDAVNNAQKAGLVYLKVNYPVIQGVSNVAMNIIHQGFAAPVRLTQAVKLDRAIGPEMAAVVDDIMGQGAVMQAAFEGVGTVARASQRLGHAMSHKVDTPSRRAAFLHEADKAGYGLKKGSPDRFLQLLTDDSKVGDLGEVAQRAKESIVDYGELGPNERAIIRRLVFVYPWQKGATKYAAHFMRDHPVQAAVLGNVGQRGTQIEQKQLGPVSSYLQGSFVGGGGLVNPSGANFFQTPAQIGEGIVGLATGNPATPAGREFLAPLPGLLLAAATRSDNIGQPLNKNPVAAMRDLTVGQTPAAQLIRAALANRSGPEGEIARKLFGSRTSTKSFPNADDPFWRFLLGGLYPRDYDKGALNKNAAREKTGR